MNPVTKIEALAKGKKDLKNEDEPKNEANL